MVTLVDNFGRVHSDLRVSVTDRCNIRCFYCMPETGGEFVPQPALLTFDEIETVVRTAVDLGIRKVRLTGGEPLLRPELPRLIERLARLDRVTDLALTTNAVLLGKHAAALARAGLRRLNIHLDTLDPARFRQITRRDDLSRVLESIDIAQQVGFERIKLNAVAIRNLTEPDLIPLVRFAMDRGFEARFIEFMPLDGQRLWDLDQVLTADEMIRRVSAEFGPLTPVPDADPRAPATEYTFSNGQKIGFIASVSRPFCMNCNRLRLTADGKLRYCLFAREETPVRHLIGNPDALAKAMADTVQSKWAGHEINRLTFIAPQRPMYSIGG